MKTLAFIAALLAAFTRCSGSEVQAKEVEIQYLDKGVLIKELVQRLSKLHPNKSLKQVVNNFSPESKSLVVGELVYDFNANSFRYLSQTSSTEDNNPLKDQLFRLRDDKPANGRLMSKGDAFVASGTEAGSWYRVIPDPAKQTRHYNRLHELMLITSPGVHEEYNYYVETYKRALANKNADQAAVNLTSAMNILMPGNEYNFVVTVGSNNTQETYLYKMDDDGIVIDNFVINDGNTIRRVHNEFIETLESDFVPAKVLNENISIERMRYYAKSLRANLEGDPTKLPSGVDVDSVFGFWVDLTVSPPKVQSVIPSTSAARANMRQGDKILKINDTLAQDIDAAYIKQLATHFDKAEITLESTDGKVRTLILTRQIKSAPNPIN
jgi:phosphotransferase system HPr-like phosphotransfer protein